MFRYPKLIVTALFLCAVLPLSAQKSVKAYIKKYQTLAVADAVRYGIPPSVILGVSIVESAAGQSMIAKALNNFFGIKGKNKSSEKKMGYKSAYREYASAAESFEHFCQILSKRKFYAGLKGKMNFKEWLRQMNASSYASAKEKWVADITQTIEKYKLTKLDETEGLAAALLTR